MDAADQITDAGSTTARDWLPAVLIGAVGLVTSGTFFYLAVYLKEALALSGTQIGVLFAVHATTGVLVTVPVGLVNDRLSSRTMVLIGLVGQAAGLAGMSLGRSFWPFLAAYFGWSLSTNLFRLSLDVQVLKTDTGRATGRRLGLYQASRFGGMGVGLVATGLLLELTRFGHVLLIAAGACLVCGLLAIKLVPTVLTTARWADYRADLLNPRVLFFAAWLFLFSSHWGAEATSYGLFIREDLGLALPSLGWFMSGEFAAITLTLLVAGRLLHREGSLRTMGVVGLLASGVGQAVMTFVPLVPSFLVRTLHGVGDGLVSLVIYFGISRLFSVGRMGGNTGFMAMATMLGYVTGALVTGPMGEQYGYGTPLWISGLVVAALAPALWLAGRPARGIPSPSASPKQAA